MVCAHITARLLVGDAVPVVTKDHLVAQLMTLLASAWWVLLTTTMALVRPRGVERAVEHVTKRRCRALILLVHGLMLDVGARAARTHVFADVLHNDSLVNTSHCALGDGRALVTTVGALLAVVVLPQGALVGAPDVGAAVANTAAARERFLHYVALDVIAVARRPFTCDLVALGILVKVVVA